MHSRARARARKNDSTYEIVAHATRGRAQQHFSGEERDLRVGIGMNKRLINYSPRVRDLIMQSRNVRKVALILNSENRREYFIRECKDLFFSPEKITRQ